MLTLLAHTGRPVMPHDLWGAWNLDPPLLVGLGLAAWFYARGYLRGPRGRAARWRAIAFAVALTALTVALVSPLEPLAGSLASAHMVQHVMLILVAAPALALSAPAGPLLRGVPLSALRVSGRWRRQLGMTPGRLRVLHRPSTAWLLHVAVLWFWHAAVPYQWALENPVVHVLEHLTFLATAWVFWHLVVGARTASRVPHGLGILLVFAMAMQSVFLSALLTFATEPWYEAYTATTAPWGLDPMADQRLAGVIMWIPGSLVYLVIALTLVFAWIRESEQEAFSPSS